MAATPTLLLSEHPDKIEAARGLLEEYLRLADAWEPSGGVPLRLPASFEGEISAFPGVAVPPEGDVIVGVAASGNIVAAGRVVPVEPFVCEFKRLYVRPDDRGKGIGRQVAEAMIGRARALGYRRAVLDVMPQRTAAIALWTHVGFRTCPPYRAYPFPMEFMGLDLAPCGK
ncbi:MAG TPA: GNAT family N-acetyltransferase [Acidimicrobiia bacterium]|nr:GNAT family N-acetyltransferase [Acidimicrobiia bacterium]